MDEKISKYMLDFLLELGNKNVIYYYSQIAQGKRLRSLLISSISKSDVAAKLAAIIECIHLSSLLHDDVIDSAKSRRGKESINSKYGDKTAIMLGDIFYSLAFSKLVEFDLRISKSVSTAVSKLSLGELQDVELSQNFNPDAKKYMDMIYNKTASLIEAGCYSAAILGEYESKAHDFKLFGRNIGLSFQIIDDILDITQDEEELGKPSLGDLKEGKSTLPFIYFYEEANESDRARFLELFGKEEISQSDKTWLRTACSGAISRCCDEAIKLTQKGVAAIEQSDAFTPLFALSSKMLTRLY